MRLVRPALFALALLIVARPAAAVPVLINFDDLADLDLVTTQYAASGITFDGTQVLAAAGGSLNEIDFPPLSFFNVASDLEPGITVSFATSATVVRGYFTYVAPVTMTAYNGTTALGSVTSLFEANYATAGGLTNELLELAFPEITSVVIQGLPGGGSFTMDDFFADVTERTSVPEPGTASLLLLAVGMWAGRRARRVVRG
jgi:hypothetical protein